MSRSANQELYDGRTNLDAGTEIPVVTALALYPHLEAKAIAAARNETGGTTVTVGYKTIDGAVHIVEVHVDGNGVATPSEERPDTATPEKPMNPERPEKPEKPKKPEKPEKPQKASLREKRRKGKREK